MMLSKKIIFTLTVITVILNGCKTDYNKNDEQAAIKDSSKAFVPTQKFDSLLSEINAVEKKIFANKLNKPDKTLALEAIKNYTEFTNQFPEDERVPEYLFKAGEISSALNLSDAAIGYFQNVYTKFPKHKKAVYALFIHAFILETQLIDLDKAKQKYQEVIDKFPNTQQAIDAKASLQYLGKSPEELVKEFEAKNKK